MATKPVTIKEQRVLAGYGWDEYPRKNSVGLLDGLRGKYDFGVDCDGAAILLGADGKPIAQEPEAACVWYKNGTLLDGAVVHNGDGRTGMEAGDDETILIDLAKLPENVAAILFTVDVFKDERKKFSLHRLENAFFRLTDPDTLAELVHTALHPKRSEARIMATGKLVRTEGGWEFRPAEVVFPKETASLGDAIRAL